MAESEVERILAQYYGGAPDTLGGPGPPPRPTPGSGPQLGQHNALNRLLAMPGQPTADALQRGLEGNATPQEVAWEFPPWYTQDVPEAEQIVGVVGGVP